MAGQKSHLDYCREQARIARAEADAATLDNVRDRCLRSEEAWTKMAARAARTEAGRARTERQ